MLQKRIAPTQADNARMFLGMRNLPTVLAKMGYKNLRPGQDRCVTTVLQGLDLLAILPTAQGKSSVWMVPAMCLKLRVLVFAPLLALIQDQLDSARRRGLAAASLSGDNHDALNELTLNRWGEGEIQVLFCAPERMRSDDFKRAMARTCPDLVVIDEAHTIAEWGDTFRTSFSQFGTFIDAHPGIRSVIAMTATATEEVRDTIKEVVRIPTAREVVYMPKRENLSFSSTAFPLMPDGKSRNEQMVIRELAALIRKHGDTIIYCATTTNVESVYKQLADELGPEYPGIAYHGQLQPDYKKNAMHKFMHGQAVWAAATNAFGMGIDKATIRLVAYYDNPASIEDVVQGWGRGGRDGLPSLGIAYHSEKAYFTHVFLIRNTYPIASDVKNFYGYLRQHADANGDVSARPVDIAKDTKIDAGAISQMTTILEKLGCISKKKIDSDTLLIRWVAAEDDKAGGKRYGAYKTACEKVGKTVNGAWSVSREVLAKELGVSEETVHKNLSDWAKINLIAYSPPPKGNIYTVKRDISGIDFSYLDKRRKEKLAGLDKLMALLKLPDHEKADAIQQHFGVPTTGVAG